MTSVLGTNPPETEDVLTDIVIYFYDQHLTWLSQLKPNVKVG